MPPISAADPIERLRGVGPTLGRALRERGFARVGDLVWLLPVGYDDLTRSVSVQFAVAHAEERARWVVRARVRSAGFVPMRGRRAVRVALEDESGSGLTAWWFFAAHGILAKAKPGTELVAIGRVSPAKQGKGAVMAHPELVGLDGQPGVRAVYPNVGLGSARLRQLISQALESEPFDPVPPDIAEREGFPSVEPAKLHLPTQLPTFELGVARERIAWAEAFGRQWLRLQTDEKLRRRPALPLGEAPGSVERVRTELGFAWTPAQARAIREIAADLARDQPMRRLLLGDVGSGKTAVVLAAAAQAIAAGAQVVVFAPTTPLAEQYARTAAAIERALGASCALLTGATPRQERARLMKQLGAGEVALLIGTHALLSEALPLPRLGLLVVDEQHRLGVAQRLFLSLSLDGRASPHLLTLSATPIPRTLALALRGELATSELDVSPPGREPVRTECLPRGDWNARVLPAIDAALAGGHGVFVVCPRIGGDEEDEAGGPGAVERHAELARRFGAARLALAHGRLPAGELSAAIAEFAAGRRPILVGTTVVEVGLDVPSATLMVIDGADHFGLSQLHQLRGRVGRSRHASRCLVVHEASPSSASLARLDALTSTTSGAELARADLALRGPGDLDGVRQSGDAGASPLEAFAEAPWLERIPSDVARLRQLDPELAAPQHLGLGLAVARLPARLTVREEAG